MIKNIILIGLMGCGKTMTAKKLAQALGRPVVSTDELIEKQEGRTIREIFEESGEQYFRKLEKKAVAEISRGARAIIDCGGGVVMDAQNLKNLKKNGVVFYLRASPEFLYENIKGKGHRPLLNVPDPLARLAELLELRRPFYEQADHIINADRRSIDQIAADILKVVNNE